VASPGHRLAGQGLVRTRDLAGDSLLLNKVDCSYRRLFEQILDEAGVSVKPSGVFHSVETLKRCVMAGAGITILPEVSVSEDIERRKLIPLAWEEGKLEVAVLMIYSKGRWLSPTLQAFMEVARRALKWSLC